MVNRRDMTSGRLPVGSDQLAVFYGAVWWGAACV